MVPSTALWLWLLSTSLHLQLVLAAPPAIVYDRLPDTDFSSHTRPGGWERRYGTPEPCGPGDAGGHKLPACNITFLEVACANLCGCAGFNSNGWLKSCSSEPHCTKKHLPGTDAYVGSRPGGADGCSPAPPHPSPPPPPSPPQPPPASQCASAATTAGAMHGPVEDWHYPPEEPQERAAMMSALPTLLSVTATANSSGTAKLTSGGVSATVSVGQLAFGSWQLLAFLRPPDQHAHPTEPNPQGRIDGGTRVVLERRFARWSTLLFLSTSTDGEAGTGAAAAPPVLIRSGIGEVSSIRQPDYNFSDPCYFERATRHPHDYLGEHLLNTSSFAEPSFVDAGECSAQVVLPRPQSAASVPPPVSN